MEKIAEEIGRTVRAAISGWPQTARLLCLLAAATAAGILVILVRSGA